jgi:uncharacterized protein
MLCGGMQAGEAMATQVQVAVGGAEVEDFQRMLKGLMTPSAYPHAVADVHHIETHISHVLLAGDFAYKFKKPIDLGFLDFSTLARRRFCCDEELRLNRRLAEDIYIDVLSVTGTPDSPRMGGEGPVLEYAVRMHRFPQESLLDRQQVSEDLMRRLAELVADFHARIPVADPASEFGTPSAVLAPMLENLEQVRARVRLPENLVRLERLERWIRERWALLIPTIEQRRRQGFVRECHGDMHRGNIAVVGDAIHVFDAIEFNPNLRWIDTASEIAFLVMDLEQAGDTGPARFLLNRYLECSGDYDGLAMLDFYKVYRAMVRAKVLAIRLDQGHLEPGEAAADRRECARYIQLAESYSRPHTPRLIVACGLSGSGKSRLSCRLREAIPLIHLRSDVERKRLFGLTETTRSLSGVDNGIYFPAATDWTYDRLYRLAGRILASGYDVLVDASFIARDRRLQFHRLARQHRVPFAILALDAPLDLLRQRVVRRLAFGEDPSEANLAVLDRQYLSRQPLGEDELAYAIPIDTSCAPSFGEILKRVEAVFERDPADEAA